jgi:hypothetical protein
MVKQSNRLAELHVANPCPADWEKMIGGNDRVRHCPTCQREVYNLSAMNSQNAEEVLKRKEQGRVCVRFARRADGTVITQESQPQGSGTARKVLLLIVALLGLFVLSSFLGWPDATEKPGSRQDLIEHLRQHEPLKTVLNWLWPPPPPPSEDTWGMGW